MILRDNNFSKEFFSFQNIFGVFFLSIFFPFFLTLAILLILFIKAIKSSASFRIEEDKLIKYYKGGSVWIKEEIFYLNEIEGINFYFYNNRSFFATSYIDIKLSGIPDTKKIFLGSNFLLSELYHFSEACDEYLPGKVIVIF
ncbi:MAG: hypothetical protein IPN79_04185 [Saprospiraceae bacterium]|nr:hypothetical protein [Saprospiraceae bacterium]